MTAQAFQARLELKSTLALRVIQRLGRETRMLELKIVSLVLKDVPTRLAAALLELAEDSGQPCAHGWAQDLVISQQELADLIGARRSVVNATLKQRQRQGLLVPHRRLICLADLERLSGVAHRLGTRSKPTVLQLHTAWYPRTVR